MNTGIWRRGFSAATALALTLGAAVVASPAQASERPVDITGYKVSSVTVADSNCRNISVSATTKIKSDYVDSYGYVDVTRSGGLVDSLWFDNRKITDRAQICPSFTGLGAYKVGPADISATYDYWDDYFQDYMEDYADYIDGTAKTFYVRGKTTSSLKAKRSGKKVTLTATAKVYSPEKYRYAQYNAKNAKFQVKTGTGWKTLKTVNLNKGTAKITLTQAKRKTYRLSVPVATWAAATNSKSATK